MSVLKRRREGNILTVTMDRPDSLNALNDELIGALLDVFQQVESDEPVRCLILEGRGDAFCAGGDIHQMNEGSGDEDGGPAAHREYIQAGSQELTQKLYHLPIPTIAKVQGFAVGAGLGLALSCDFVVAGEGSKFGAAFRNVGYGPDSGVAFLLAHYAGPRTALELLYTGEVISAERARDLDLVNRCVPTDEVTSTVEDLARQLGEGPTQALAASKRLVQESLESDFDSVLRAEATEQAILNTTEDHEEGVKAFVEGREPEFRGR